MGEGHEAILFKDVWKEVRELPLVLDDDFASLIWETPAQQTKEFGEGIKNLIITRDKLPYVHDAFRIKLKTEHYPDVSGTFFKEGEHIVIPKSSGNWCLCVEDGVVHVFKREWKLT